MTPLSVRLGALLGLALVAGWPLPAQAQEAARAETEPSTAEPPPAEMPTGAFPLGESEPPAATAQAEPEPSAVEPAPTPAPPQPAPPVAAAPPAAPFVPARSEPTAPPQTWDDSRSAATPHDSGSMQDPAETRQRTWLEFAPELAWPLTHQSRINGELTDVETQTNQVEFMPGVLLRADVPVFDRFSLAALGRLNRFQTGWGRRMDMPARILLGAGLAPSVRFPVLTRSGRPAVHFHIGVPLGLDWAVRSGAPNFEAASSEVDTGFGYFFGLALGGLVAPTESLGVGLQVSATEHSLEQTWHTESADGMTRVSDEVEETFSVLHFAILVGGAL